jgi:hypothetical protein
MTERVLAREMSTQLFESIMHAIKTFTVGFTGIDDSSASGIVRADLLGSGSLVEVGTTRAILTAHHVIEILPKSGRIGVLLEETGAESGSYSVDTNGLHFLKIDRGSNEAIGPDLGAVVLAPTIASTLAAKKSFFNLSRRREEVLTRPRTLDDGLWTVQGFLDERTTETTDTEARRYIKTFYNYSGFGGPEETLKISGYDYFDFPVSFSGRSQAPINWGGMSGGGLWQIPLKRDGTEIVMASLPLLSGVVFYQYPTTETSCGIRTHGRESVYRVAYDAILNSRA